MMSSIFLSSSVSTSISLSLDDEEDDDVEDDDDSSIFFVEGGACFLTWRFLGGAGGLGSFDFDCCFGQVDGAIRVG